MIWAVLVVHGLVTASIGPWPADLANCRANLAASNHDLDQTFADPVRVAKLRETHPGLQRDDVRWECVQRGFRPRNGVPFRPIPISAPVLGQEMAQDPV